MNTDEVTAQDLPDNFEIAVVVLVRANGVDHGDAVHRAEKAVAARLREPIPLPQRAGTVDGLTVETVAVRELNAAARTRLIDLTPGKEAFRR